MDPRLLANRDTWDRRVPIHVASRFYDVEGWLLEAPGPPTRERDAIGDVAGRTLIHLQCHFGMDTLQWARAGAVVTGVDFSSVAITQARELAQRAGLADRATFVCANVYDAPAALGDRRFDVVYVSLESLGWLPRIAAWGEVVARLMAPGATLYLHDVHPFAASLDEGGERVEFGYFEEPEAPFVSVVTSTYTDGADLPPSSNYEWSHSLGEIVGALRDQGLVVESLEEHDWTHFAHFPWLEEASPGVWAAPPSRPRFPLSFTLVARSLRPPTA